MRLWNYFCFVSTLYKSLHFVTSPINPFQLYYRYVTCMPCTRRCNAIMNNQANPSHWPCSVFMGKMPPAAICQLVLSFFFPMWRELMFPSNIDTCERPLLWLQLLCSYSPEAPKGCAQVRRVMFCWSQLFSFLKNPLRPNCNLATEGTAETMNWAPECVMCVKYYIFGGVLNDHGRVHTACLSSFID